MISRRFVIGDIHGCALTFRGLVEDVIRLQMQDSLYLLGDYIDRGPRTKDCLDYILDLLDIGYHVRCLRGNHEEMLLNSESSTEDYSLWMMNGGLATLDSFGIESASEIPSRYMSFLNDLPLYIVLKDFVLVHASLNFDISDPFADKEAMVWRRRCSVDISKIGNRRLINGHTPVTRDELMASLHASRIMLDNGCVFKYPGLGSLAALELDSMKVFWQKNID